MPRLTNGLEQVLTNLGIVGSGYKLFFYETGTTTLKTTYSDEDLTVANTNPIVLNSAGRPSVDVWGSDPSLYRMILGTPDSVVGNITTIVDADPVDNYQIDNIAGLNPIPTAYWGTTAGTSTAYTLEEPLVDIASYSNIQTFFVDFHIACGASPTLKVKDLAAITFKKYEGDGTTTDLVANDLQIQRYLCINNGTNIVVLNPRYPENLNATTSTKGVSLLPQQITIANGTDTEHDLNFSAGNAQADDGSLVFSVSALTKQIDATWVAGTNQGGLDTGNVANDIPYYIFAIYNTTTSTSDILFSTSKTSPTLPSGYTKKQYLGACRTDGSANIRNGKWSYDTKGSVYEFIYNNPILELSTTTPATLKTNITMDSIPNSFTRIVAKYLDDDTTGNAIIIFDANRTDVAPTQQNATLFGNNNLIADIQDYFLLDGSANLSYRASDGAAQFFEINNLGWKEYL